MEKEPSEAMVKAESELVFPTYQTFQPANLYFIFWSKRYLFIFLNILSAII